MNIEGLNGFPASWGVERIRQDTLVLYDDFPDGYGNYLSKQN